MHPFHILFETVSSASLAEKFRAREPQLRVAAPDRFVRTPPGQSGARGARSVIANAVTCQRTASACPVDYVAAPLLAATSAVIGHARWPFVTKPFGVSERLWPAASPDVARPGLTYDKARGTIVEVAKVRIAQRSGGRSPICRLQVVHQPAWNTPPGPALAWQLRERFTQA
jgi:hypothetical protein